MMAIDTLDSLLERLCAEQRLRGEVMQGITMQRAYDEWSRRGGPCQPFEDAHLDRVFQAGIAYALGLLGQRYLGVDQWEGGDGTETVEGDVLVEIGNIFWAARLVDGDGDPLNGERLRQALLHQSDNVIPLRGGRHD